MSRRYDSRTTIFSPQGRLYQVEYAMEAISQAGAAVGILAKDGVVFAAEKKVTSQLLDMRNAAEKMYKISDHIACSVAGITSDANILINYARETAQQYYYTFQEPISVEYLLQIICDLKQGYTQFGGQRPFGVSFLVAGWDRHFGFQLYQSDPSGNYGGWKATAIGGNNQQAISILKSDYKMDDTSLHEALLLGVKVFSKTMDTSKPTVDKLEFSTLTRDENGEVKFHIFTRSELEALLKEYDQISEQSGDI